MRTMNAFLALVSMLPLMSGLSYAGAHDDMVLLPVKNDPTISFRLWFKVGSQNDPKGKEGLASITASMLTDASTLNNSYEQVLDKLYPLAAGYSASTSVEMTVVQGRTHKDNLKAYYPLLMDALLRPAFREDDLERIRSQVLNSLENSLRYANDEDLGKAILYADLFSGTGYAHVSDGLVQSVKSITLDDVRSFYKEYYTSANVVVGLAGSYDESLPGMVRKDLGNLPSATVPPAPVPVPVEVKGVKVTIVEKEAPATAISMGFPIEVLRGSREWYALAIANSWLGEHRNSSSHLYKVIRETRGLNYGDYSYIENFPNGSRLQMPPQNVSRRKQIFEIWIRPVPNEARHFAIRTALREFKNLVEKGMSESDFNLTRKFLKKYALHYAPTTMERLGYALDDRFYGIEGSHLEKFRTMMDQITLDEVNATIRKHWQYGNMQIAIVTTDAEGMKNALVSNASSPITYTSPKLPEVLEEDKEIVDFGITVKPEDVKIVKVAEVFER